jgi:hypothetical protein
MILETRTQRIWLEADGIVRAKMFAHVELDRVDAEEAIHAIAKVTGGARRPVLVDMTQIKFMTREARTYFAGPETANAESAAALLIRSPLARAIGNFFMGLNKPLMPTRLFTSEEAALTWLRDFVS